MKDTEGTNLFRKKSRFGMVNFTMVRRVALMAAQRLPEVGLVKQWIRTFGGRPVGLAVTRFKLDLETDRIKWQQIEEFQRDKDLWKDLKWDEAFGSVA
jgi:hypothetical protein